jgi:hypothetical protein
MKSSTLFKGEGRFGNFWDIGVTNVFHVVHTSHQVVNDFHLWGVSSIFYVLLVLVKSHAVLKFFPITPHFIPYPVGSRFTTVSYVNRPT